MTQAAEKMLLVRAEEDQIPQISPPCARALEPVDAQEEANLKQASPYHQIGASPARFVHRKQISLAVLENKSLVGDFQGHRFLI